MFWDAGSFFWVIQVCGLCAFLIQHGACFLPCGKKILQVQTGSCVLWGLYYLFLGMPNIAAMSGVAAVRNIVSSSLTPKYLKQFNLSYSLLVLMILLYFWQGWMDIFIMLGVLTIYLRLNSRDHLLHFHAWGIAGALLFSIYHVYNEAWFGILNDGVGVMVCVTAFLKTYYDHKRITLDAQSAQAAV